MNSFISCFRSLSLTKKSFPKANSQSRPQESPSLVLEAPPMEIICDILVRLPVKDILRYKIVSRAWYELINSPHFIKLHLNRTLLKFQPEPYSRSDAASDFDPNIILSSPKSLQVVDFQTLRRTQKMDLPPSFTPAEFVEPRDSTPLLRDESAPLVVGSCHGLVCLYSSNSSEAVLCNPSTQAKRIIPGAPSRPDSISVTFGFGYDSRGDDYKLVKIENFLLRDGLCRPIYTREIRVYSLRSDSWKVLAEEQNPEDEIESHGALVNDRLHWVSVRRGDETSGSIVSFDLTEEEFGEVPIPPYYGQMVHYPKDVAVVGGKLCFMTQANSHGIIQYIDVWTMDEYGMDNTWFRLYSVWCMQFPYPVAFWTKDDLVLYSEGGRVSWYDRRQQKIAQAKIHDAEYSFDATLCMPTLVPVTIKRRIGGEIVTA